MNRILFFISCLIFVLGVNTNLLAQAKQINYGKDSVTCVQNLSMYEEYYKQKNYDDAFEGWRWIFSNCPEARKSCYINGINLFEYKIKKETDAAKKELYIDTLMIIYDQRIKYFNEEGYVLGRKGADLYSYRPKNSEEIYSILKKSVDLQGDKSEPTPVFRCFQAAVSLYNQKKMSKEDVIDLFDKFMGIINANSANTNFKIAKENVEAIFEPIASCEDLVSLYTPKFNAATNDTVVLKKIVSMLSKKKCEKSELFFNASTNLHKASPTAASAMNLAHANVDRNKSSVAIQYYEEAVKLDTSNENKAQYYYEMAEVTFKNLKNYQDARSHAQKAINLKGDWGKPYLMIGEIYVAASSACGENDFQKQTVFWAAVDKFQRAKSVDPSVAEEANKNISTYSKYFPQKNDVFFQGLQNGAPYKINCWIGETTTVRVP